MSKFKAIILIGSIIGFMIILIIILSYLFIPYKEGSNLSEAESQLNHIHTLEKVYQINYSKFSSDLPEIGFEAPKTIKEDGTANYEYEIIEASVNSFKARATAVADFDQDGTFDVWEIDQDKKLVNTVKD